MPQLKKYKGTSYRAMQGLKVVECGSLFDNTYEVPSCKISKDDYILLSLKLTPPPVSNKKIYTFLPERKKDGKLAVLAVGGDGVDSKDKKP